MSAHLDSLRLAYEALGRPGGLADVADGLLAPDVELDFSALPDGGVLTGVAAFRVFRQGAPWAGEVSVVPEEMIEVSPDRVLVLVRVSSHAPGMGDEVDGRFAHLVTFRADRVVRWQLFTDRAAARRAAAAG